MGYSFLEPRRLSPLLGRDADVGATDGQCTRCTREDGVYPGCTWWVYTRVYYAGYAPPVLCWVCYTRAHAGYVTPVLVLGM